MIRFIFTLFAVAISSLPALAEDNPVVHKNELPGLIKQYLMDNPNVIIDAVQQAEKKAQEAESRESEAAVARFKDQIIDANAPTIGKPDAKVTIVEFYDYNCSACKFMFHAIDQLHKEGLGDTRIVFKEFPIFGEQSELLARMAIAVNRLDKDKFFDFHAGMMKFKGHPEDAQIEELVNSIGLKISDVRKEADSEKVRAIVDRNKQLGAALKIGGTPFVIVNGKVVPHALDYDGLKQYINEAGK